MKKIVACVCLVLALMVSAPVAAADGNTHFDNPVSVCADETGIYVADSGSEQSVIYRFGDSAEEIPAPAAVGKIRVDGGKLYIMSADTLTVYDLAEKSRTTLTATGIIDFAVSGEYLYSVFSDGIRRNEIASLGEVENLATEETRVVSDNSVSAVETQGQDIYYISDGKLEIKSGEIFKNPVRLSGQTDIAADGQNIFVYDSAGLSLADVENSSLRNIHAFDFNVVDVFASDSTVYVINGGQFQVYVYNFDGQALTLTDEIYGSNEKDYPTEYPAIDSFADIGIYTAARDTYFYASSGTDGWHGYIAAGSAVMALNSHDGFYYALYFNADGDALFGFVEAADMTAVAQTEISAAKVTVTSNESLYTLPIESDLYCLTDGGNAVTISNTQNVTALCFITGFAGDRWALVSVDGYSGFIPANRLKDPPVTYPSYEVKIANPRVGTSLSVYAEQSEDSAVLARIRSGEMLKVFRTENGWSLVQITVDGQETYGWAQNDYLINEGTMTDTVALGLALGIILLLCVGFAVFWKIRYNRYKKKDK